MVNEWNYAVITHGRTNITFSGIGRNGHFAGSWSLEGLTKQAAMVAVLKVLEDHGVTDYEIIKGG